MDVGVILHILALAISSLGSFYVPLLALIMIFFNMRNIFAANIIENAFLARSMISQ